MPDQIAEYKNRNKQKFLLILVLSILGLLCIAALMHIGAGDAEWAGITISNITPANAMEYNIPKEEKGVVINWCEDPSYSSGLRGGDLLKAMNNKKIRNVTDFLKAAKEINLEQGALLDIMRNGQPMYLTLKKTVGVHDTFKQLMKLDMGSELPGVHGSGTNTASGGHQIAFANRLPAETAETGTLSMPVDPALTNAQLPTPKEQGAAQKELIEGHWLGLELIPLVPELAKEFNIAPDTKGLLIDEISLEGAESGILAGDLVMAVDDFATPDLVQFTEATRRVKNRTSAKVLVSRRGQLLEFTVTSLRTLGFSQNEAAQPITPGAISPHRSRGKACTECHIIMITGGQLPTDAGDILPNPPPILKGAVCPHEYRGKCNSCHFILKSTAQ